MLRTSPCFMHFSSVGLVSPLQEERGAGGRARDTRTRISEPRRGQTRGPRRLVRRASAVRAAAVSVVPLAPGGW